MKTKRERKPGAVSALPIQRLLPAHRRRWLIAFAIAGLLAVLAAIFIQRRAEPALPSAPTHYLDDQAGLLSPAFAAAKDQYIQHLSRTMRIAQINIVILPRMPDGALEDFTIRAATEWKLGAGGVDNGLLLFVFPDRRMLRLEVGYGLEAVITDAVARRLLAEQFIPAFSRGRFEQGIEDFLAELDRTLESSEAANQRAAPYAALLPFVMSVLRNAPSIGLRIWHVFLAQDLQGRLVLGLFGAVFAAMFASALTAVAAGIPALLMLPWRLVSSRSLRTVSRAALKEQFSPMNFLARPPPFLTGLYEELQLGAILGAMYSLAAIVFGIGFLFVGSSIFVGGLGRFGGAGATLGWPAL